MQALPDALKPLGNYPQFILYRLTPRAGGKTQKMPIDYRTGQPFAAGSNWQQDPEAMTTFENAKAAAKPGYKVGFLFTPRDPFFFLDIDNCLVDGAWSPEAMNVLRALPGAAVEVSQSGTGLHIFGTYRGVPPAHGVS